MFNTKKSERFSKRIVQLSNELSKTKTNPFDKDLTAADSNGKAFVEGYMMGWKAEGMQNITVITLVKKLVTKRMYENFKQEVVLLVKAVFARDRDCSDRKDYIHDCSECKDYIHRLLHVDDELHSREMSAHRPRLSSNSGDVVSHSHEESETDALIGTSHLPANSHAYKDTSV